MRKTSVPRICEVCNASFEVQPYRLKADGNNGRFCKMKCYNAWKKGNIGHLTRPDVETAILIDEYLAGETLKALAKKYDMTAPGIAYRLEQAGVKRRKYMGDVLRRPDIVQRAREANSQKRGKKNHRFVELPIDVIVAEYEAGASAAIIAAKHRVTDTTILRKLHGAGIQTRKRGFRQFVLCTDGHRVYSSLERAVDEWLYQHNLFHEIRPWCPWHGSQKNEHSADFKVGDTYIEVWGVEGNREYDERRALKVKRYAEMGAPLIQIFPHHVYDNDFSPLEVLL